MFLKKLCINFNLACSYALGLGHTGTTQYMIVWVILAQHNIWLSVLFKWGGATKHRGVTNVWWFTFEPPCLEQTMFTFLNVMVLINHYQACDSFAAVHVQKLWQLPGVNFWSLLMFFFLWFSGVGSHLVCLGSSQVQYGALYWESAGCGPSFCPKCYYTQLLHLHTCGHQFPAWGGTNEMTS